jgi:hypothetical protein
MNLLSTYAKEVLSFRMDGEPEPAVSTPLPPERREQWITRCLQTLQQRQLNTVLLFGMGTGELAQNLARKAPQPTRLVVVEQVPATARALAPVLSQYWEIMADCSMWACLCLASLSGITAATTHLCLNPELPAGPQRTANQTLQRLMTRIGPETISRTDIQCDLSAAAILSPDEPELEIFFGQFPKWIRELCVVWDAPEVPDISISCPARLRQVAQPLTDFSSQRNRMLSMCSGSHVLYLDGDEMLHPGHWDMIPALCAHDKINSVFFPRQTLYPDEAHTKIGLGLWPDLQLRLFRNTGSAHFERPIHERLTGVDRAVAIALDMPIQHHSRLRKTQQQLEAKLARFDAAANRENMHLLNREYPQMPTALLNGFAQPKQCRLLVLPDDVHI